MCMLGNRKSEIINLNESEGLIGYRGWYITNSFTDKIDDKRLRALNTESVFDVDKPTIAVCSDGYDMTNEHMLQHECGIYAYNNNNNYDYNYNNNNNYYYYYLAGKIIQFDDVIQHDKGNRSKQARIIQLVRLTPKYVDKQLNKFIENFNNVVEQVAKIYDVEVIDHVDFK